METTEENLKKLGIKSITIIDAKIFNPTICINFLDNTYEYVKIDFIDYFIPYLNIDKLKKLNLIKSNQIKLK